MGAPCARSPVVCSPRGRCAMAKKRDANEDDLLNAALEAELLQVTEKKKKKAQAVRLDDEADGFSWRRGKAQTRA